MNGVEYRNRMEGKPRRREGAAACGIVRALPALAALGVLALGVMQAGPARAETFTSILSTAVKVIHLNGQTFSGITCPDVGYGYAASGGCGKDQPFNQAPALGGRFRYDGHSYEIIRLYVSDRTADAGALVMRIRGQRRTTPVSNLNSARIRLVAGRSNQTVYSLDGNATTRPASVSQGAVTFGSGTVSYRWAEFKWASSGQSWRVGSYVPVRIEANPPGNVAPYFAVSAIACSFAENSTAGAPVCATRRFRIYDANGDDLTYTLGGENADKFTIDSSTGAICTAAARALSNALPAATVPGPPGLSVADAAVPEAAGATLDFEVTPSRPATQAVTVAYATADGTATAASDYTSTSGTLTFAEGEASHTVSVPVLADALDEGPETLTVALSNASGGNAYIAVAAATGTIGSGDAVPQGWLARFGRTVGGQAVDAIGRRLQGGGKAHATLGGQTLDLTGGRVRPPPEEGREAGYESFAGTGEAARTLTMSGRELPLGSSFHLTAGGDAGRPAWTAWGRLATGRFAAEEDDRETDGQVTSGFVGADIANERWLAGVALSISHSDGKLGATQSVAGGDMESSLTALYPYARMKLNERLQLWTLAGFGRGELELRMPGRAGASGQTLRPDISMWMGAPGLEPWTRRISEVASFPRTVGHNVPDGPRAVLGKRRAPRWVTQTSCRYARDGFGRPACHNRRRYPRRL